MESFRNYEKYYRLYAKGKPQRELCLEYLQEYGTITPLEALRAFGCFRLSAIIYRLRREGYNIQTGIAEDNSYAIYTLISEKGENDEQLTQRIENTDSSIR